MAGSKVSSSNIRLSVCIPIYNFGEFIGETLESIISQATDEVEIVVVDGGSTDNTQDVIRKYQRTFSQINYLRLDERGGIDADMAKTIEIAKGDYCWTFGGDDIMQPGAIERILGEIESGVDLYLCEDILCTFDLRPIRKHQILSFDIDTILDLCAGQDRKTYFEHANSPAAFFGFCGALIFKKSRWFECEKHRVFNGTCWAQAARFLEMIPHGLIVKYISQPLLKKRSDNDSFSEDGLVRRFGLEIDGYNKMADYFFGADSLEAFHIRRSLRAEQTLRHIMNLKLSVSENNRAEIPLLNSLVAKLYSDASLTNLILFATYKWAPLGAYKLVKSTYRNLKLLSQ